MKKILSVITMALFALAICAQEKDITTFLGIPVDGYKAEMKKKLIEKGFTYVAQKDYFEGEFNGTDVHVFIVTNNNKVYRIMVVDAHGQDEENIKIRFNNLVHQFENNKRYLTSEDQTISKRENISYKMAVRNKIYEAIFFQLPKNYKMPLLFTEEDIKKAMEEMEPAFKKPVWFRIDESYGEYRIIMFYDNEYNQANGEDL